MPSIPYSTCPQCHGALPIRVLWDFSRHSRFGLIGQYGTLTGKIGIVCPHCGIKLRIVQTRIRLVLVATITVVCTLLVYSRTWIRGHQLTVNGWLQILALGTVLAVVHLFLRMLIPHFADVRP